MAAGSPASAGAAPESGEPGAGASRRHAATIVALDVVGYSRLMGVDESQTHRRVQKLIGGPVADATRGRGGALVKSTGDGALLRFDSAVDALHCALDIMAKLPGENEDQPRNRRIELRVGINKGDVIVESGDIFGDAVNVAIRLESIARPGTICVSHGVVDEIADKFSFEFEDLGYQHLKNIKRPVHAFIIDTRPRRAVDPRAVAIAPGPLAGFEGRPAIAVLPFLVVGASAGPDQDYLGEGLADDVIEQLSGWRTLPVIARNSSFQFRGPDAELRAVGEELGARYVVTGEVHLGDRLARVRTRLADARSGIEIFAHVVETARDGFPAADSEIAQLVVGAIEPEILRVERERVVRSPTRRPGTYDLFMRGLWHHYRYSPAHSAEAIALFRRIIAADPGDAQAHAALAVSIMTAVQMGWRDGPEHSYAAAHAIARQAVDIDPRAPFARFALGGACMWLGRMPEADIEMGEAIALNPSYAAAHAISCAIHAYLGRHEAAFAAGMRALRLSPHDTRLSLWLPGIARACFHLRRYEDAIAYGQKALARRPGYSVPLRYLVAAKGWLGRGEGLDAELAELRLAEPNLDDLRAKLARLYVNDADLGHLVEGLRRAGM